MNTALKALQLKAKHQVYTLLQGNNFSYLQGEGYDFLELREYQIGDDIRKINWTITAKLGKPYIKELHANKELSIVVSTLMDGSLYYGLGNKKQKTFTEVATLLGYATQQQNDLFTGVGYTPTQTIFTLPTKQLYHIEEFSKELYETPLLGTTLDIDKSIAKLFNHIKKPSLIFIISDFLESVDLSLLAQKHEVIAIIVREYAEDFPKDIGDVTLLSPQTNNKLETIFGKSTKENYIKKRKQHDEKLTKHFSEHHIRSVKIFTDDDAVKKLITLFI